MSETEFRATFHVPEDLADDLIQAGLARRSSPPLVSTGGSPFIVSAGFATALIVLDVSGDLIALTGIRPPLRTVVDLIINLAQEADAPLFLIGHWNSRAV